MLNTASYTFNLADNIAGNPVVSYPQGLNQMGGKTKKKKKRRKKRKKRKIDECRSKDCCKKPCVCNPCKCENACDTCNGKDCMNECCDCVCPPKRSKGSKRSKRRKRSKTAAMMPDFGSFFSKSEKKKSPRKVEFNPVDEFEFISQDGPEATGPGSKGVSMKQKGVRDDGDLPKQIRRAYGLGACYSTDIQR